MANFVHLIVGEDYLIGKKSGIFKYANEGYNFFNSEGEKIFTKDLVPEGIVFNCVGYFKMSAEQEKEIKLVKNITLQNEMEGVRVPAASKKFN